MNLNDLLAHAQRVEAERDALAVRLEKLQRVEAERDALALRLEKLLSLRDTERADDIAIGRALARDEFTKVTGHHE